MQINPFGEEDSLEKPQTPVVYVEGNPAWEYRLLVRDLGQSDVATEGELNPIGEEGWELVSIAVHSNQFYYYFKRMK